MKKKKIFIAEDDGAILDVMQIILSDAGYDLMATREDGIEKKIYAYRPDLILLDIWIGGEDGGKITKRLKRTKRTKHTPVIIISANRDTAMIAKEVRADGFLAKPFDMEDLLSIVKRHIK